MVVMMTGFLARRNRGRRIVNWPFAIIGGFAFTIPYMLTAFFGPEFPALFGALVGMVIMAVGATKDFWFPRTAGIFRPGKMAGRLDGTGNQSGGLDHQKTKEPDRGVGSLCYGGLPASAHPAGSTALGRPA